jgi:hypothetical protein
MARCSIKQKYRYPSGPCIKPRSQLGYTDLTAWPHGFASTALCAPSREPRWRRERRASQHTQKPVYVAKVPAKWAAHNEGAPGRSRSLAAGQLKLFRNATWSPPARSSLIRRSTSEVTMDTTLIGTLTFGPGYSSTGRRPSAETSTLSTRSTRPTRSSTIRNPVSASEAGQRSKRNAVGTRPNALHDPADPGRR